MAVLMRDRSMWLVFRSWWACAEVRVEPGESVTTCANTTILLADDSPWSVCHVSQVFDTGGHTQPVYYVIGWGEHIQFSRDLNAPVVRDSQWVGPILFAFLKSWKSPFSADIYPFQHLNYSILEGLCEWGCVRMSPIEETLAGYLSQGDASSLKELSWLNQVLALDECVKRVELPPPVGLVGFPPVGFK